MKRLLVFALLALSAGCTVGPRVENVGLAREPRGASVTLQVGNRTFTGELLEVQDTALLVLSNAQAVTLVPYRLLSKGEAEGRWRVQRGGRPPTAAQRENLRRVSRFPQGIDAELRRALLAAYGQAEVEVLRP
jgi:hypothetical protein